MGLVRCFAEGAVGFQKPDHRGQIVEQEPDGNEWEVVGMVPYTDNLDRWDGRNRTCGQTGRHLGIGKAKNGQFYVCHGTQWQSERDWAVIISADDAKKLVLLHNPSVYKGLFSEPVPAL
jgi:hypothetical protein